MSRSRRKEKKGKGNREGLKTKKMKENQAVRSVEKTRIKKKIT